MRKFLLGVGICFAIAGCSFNPFNSARTLNPTIPPLPTDIPISELRQQLEQQVGKTFPTILPTSTGTVSPGPVSPTAPLRQEIALQPAAANIDGRGYATRLTSANRYELSLLADLPDLSPGTWYQVWLAKGQSGQPNYIRMKIGRLKTQKGGYLLEYSANQNLVDYQEVLISQEQTDDNNAETIILTGTFNSNK